METKTSEGVTIRMFCQGLGDCFLIKIPQTDERPYWMLIDCGVAMNADGADELMKSVVMRIADLTGGVVDLLVITHEHYDHVSGFVHAAELLTLAEGSAPVLAFKHFW